MGHGCPGSTSLKHLGLKLLALCAPHLVPSVISRGAPHQATWETSVSEGRNWVRNGRSILPVDSNFHVNHRILLHAANLQHGTDGFTSPPKKGTLWIFFARKIWRFRPGSNPCSWVPEDSTLTYRPPKPLVKGQNTVTINMCKNLNPTFLEYTLPLILCILLVLLKLPLEQL
jgi:hypothetical protein